MVKAVALEETTHFINAAAGDFPSLDQGRCRGRGGAHVAWKVSHGGVRKIGTVTIENDKLIEFALSVCGTCPAQWDCARFGVLTNADACTWGVDIEDLRWLKQRKEYGLELIDAAQELQVPIQVMVRDRVMKTRRKRTKPAA